MLIAEGSTSAQGGEKHRRERLVSAAGVHRRYVWGGRAGEIWGPSRGPGKDWLGWDGGLDFCHSVKKDICGCR